MIIATQQIGSNLGLEIVFGCLKGKCNVTVACLSSCSENKALEDISRPAVAEAIISANSSPLQLYPNAVQI